VLQLDKRLLLSFFIIVLLKPASGENREAGFLLKDFPVVYYQSGANTFRPGEIAITKIHGIEIAPVQAAEKGRPAEGVVFAHTLKNLGTVSELVNFKVIAAPPGSEVKITIGTDKSVKSLVLPEKGMINFWVLFKLPPSAELGKTYELKLEASLVEKDGDAYVGYDGELHGGKDEITLIDRIEL
jgi:hypothetical protein